ncbi:hypothetical protein BO82DRAFT_105034 [Aspergillus uvarum CBS 121591]|uniref:Uncharacterized protein n=1 Tax=Aspergillus uvarum CBS 121591 TaxID=1448315 RepID=A0A319CPB7_9EURO|nr:hypothetical protein BO82DRAFT_105034 [Aspergillus uvarum CBS 121591]PYH80593.1 hypothetical protein BO82DRAFT_105034 [Aspergillus uvarum CBS 121591]
MVVEAPLSELILRSPAESVLKALQVSCLNQKAFDCDSVQRRLHPEAKLLLEACQRFGGEESFDEDISHIFNNKLLCDHVKTISQTLHRETLLKLSFLTWNFDGSGLVSKQLRQFLADPENDHVEHICNTIWQRLVDRSECKKTKIEFAQEMVSVLKNLKAALVFRWNVIYVSMLDSMHITNAL